MADQTETAGARDAVIDLAARTIHEAISTEFGLPPGDEPAIVDLGAARALARRGQLADPEQRAEIERLGARLDAARLNASDAERIANDLRAERDFALWLYAELDHQVRAALHGLDSELPDDAPLGTRVDELHESYLDALRLASEHLTDYQQRNRQLFERTAQRDKAMRERDQRQARIDKALALANNPAPWIGVEDEFAEAIRAALQGDQPAEPDAKPRCYVPGPPEEVPGG